MALEAKDDRKICGMAHASHKKLLKCVENDDAEQAKSLSLLVQTLVPCRILPEKREGRFLRWEVASSV